MSKDEHEQKEGNNTTYPMGDLSIGHQLNNLDGNKQVKELVSNCLVVLYCLVLLFAGEKQHKTFWLLQFAICVALGENFLGFSTKQGKVLFITFEGGKEYLLERAEEMAKTLFPSRFGEVKGNIGIEDLRGAMLDESVEQIEDLVKKYRPLYLICDPIDLAISGDYSSPNGLTP